VPAPEFRFDITLSRGAASGDIADVFVDVFRSVLAHVGLKGKATDRLLAQALKAQRAAPAGACTLRFRAHAGELEIALSQSGRSWRTSCPVPIR
jgi:hypothetical protein